MSFGMSGEVKAITYSSFWKNQSFRLSSVVALEQANVFTGHLKPNPVLCIDHKHRSLQRQLLSRSGESSCSVFCIL